MIAARGVEDDNARAQRNSGQRAGKVGETHSLQRNVGIMLDIGVYGREIIVARILQAAACEIDENNGVRPRLRCAVPRKSWKARRSDS